MPFKISEETQRDLPCNASLNEGYFPTGLETLVYLSKREKMEVFDGNTGKNYFKQKIPLFISYWDSIQKVTFLPNLLS